MTKSTRWMDECQGRLQHSKRNPIEHLLHLPEAATDRPLQFSLAAPIMYVAILFDEWNALFYLQNTWAMNVSGPSTPNLA
jgi:hypothetical protein